MLKKIKVTSPVLILFLFSISCLPLTQITEAEAQFSNKIQKQLSNKIPKQRSLSDAIRKPTPGKLTDKEKKKVLGKRMEWNFDTPMEKLIESINMGIELEVFTDGEIREAIVFGQNQANATFENVVAALRHHARNMLGCDAPNMITNPFCAGAPQYYRDLLRSNALILGLSIDKFVTHKPLQFCGMQLEEIVPITQVQSNAIDGQLRRRTRLRQQSPLSIKLRSLGKEFGTCFCKFGSRQGTHPSQGYENIVPDDYSNVCPL
jgi:hypothetical protein